MKIIIGALMCFSAFHALGQSSQNCDQVKTELTKAREENEYLRNALKIGKPVKEVNSDNIDFKLLKVEGNSKSQTITATLTLKTSAANWYIMSSVKSIIDIDGNEYKLKSYTIGASNYQQIEFNTDVPIKCTYTFEGVLPSVKMIKLFKFGYTHKFGEKYFVEFRDLSVDWK
jgi:hypothetical protein